MNLTEVIDKTTEHRKELTELKFLEVLKERATNGHAVMKKSPIFREDHGPEMMLVTPSERETRSAFWVDKLIRTQPAWARFPSRTRFISGYTSLDRLEGDSKTHYVLIPLDGTRIGICPGASFYKSFSRVEKGMGLKRVDNDALAHWAEMLYRAVSEVTSEFKADIKKPESFAEFNGILKSIDKALNGKQSVLRKKIKSHEGMEDDERVAIIDLLDRHVTNCETYLGEKLDPEQNDFSSVRVESFGKLPTHREVWIDSPVLLIRRDTYIELHKKGRIK
jgi:hypothetical protein